MTELRSEAPVLVSKTQVRAAQELVRLRGEQHVHPIVRQVAGLEYEQELLKALQRHQPSRAVLRRHVPLGALLADFVLDDGATLLAVEAKFTKQPLGPEGVQQARLELEQLHDQVSQHVEMLVVSCSGFRRQAIAAGTRSPALLLVTWAGRDDDEQLAAAVAGVFAPGG